MTDDIDSCNLPPKPLLIFSFIVVTLISAAGERPGHKRLTFPADEQ